MKALEVTQANPSLYLYPIINTPLVETICMAKHKVKNREMHSPFRERRHREEEDRDPDKGRIVRSNN